MDKEKIVFKGSHPDSLYRVPVDSGAGAGKMVRVLRILRWPAALVVVCIALAVFVYFLMPDEIPSDLEAMNTTYWDPVKSESAHSHSHKSTHNQDHPEERKKQKTTESKPAPTRGTKITEIDFYDAENDKSDSTAIITSELPVPARKLPIPPVFPSHLSPEVQYGNERADNEKLRSPKLLGEKITVSDDSTLKPHITQKPEKPLAVYFKEGAAITSPSTETIYKAETNNDFTNYGEKVTTKDVEDIIKLNAPIYKAHAPALLPIGHIDSQQDKIREPEESPAVHHFYNQPANYDLKFTSGHSKLFGISIEDAEKMGSTTQSSVYNTRVSPTLPTWRDGDDATTKNYPINLNSDVQQCRSTRLALCRGVLPYDLAGAAATVNGVKVTTMLSQIEYLVATNCSDRVRHFTCALLEPECSPPPYPSKLPCFSLCKAIVDNCDGQIPRDLSPAFDCNVYPKNNCVAARTPCFSREFSCADGTCTPRDWICDGNADCPNGEDESNCALCEKNEFRCRSGGCIMKRWLCDGYADCPGGEDEADEMCEARGVRAEPGEESAGSAPAPAVRRPNRMPSSDTGDLHTTGENDSSKELLITSDSTNALKRNFTRRPSPSRLTPYTRPMLHNKPKNPTDDVVEPKNPTIPRKPSQKQNLQKLKQEVNQESSEDVNIGDLFFEEFEKEKELEKKRPEKPTSSSSSKAHGTAPAPPDSTATRLGTSMNKFDKVINGAAMLKKAAQEEADDSPSSPETNSTSFDKAYDMPDNRPGSISAHASPCPSGELRCVDGRCITLAQLCDGTIDCSDHADEDNCYT